MLGFHVRDIYAERGPISGVQQDGGSWEYHGKAVHVHLSTHSNMQVTDTRPPPPYKQQHVSHMRCDPNGVMPNQMLVKTELAVAGGGSDGSTNTGAASDPPAAGAAKAKAKAKAKQPPKAKSPEQQAKTVACLRAN